MHDRHKRQLRTSIAIILFGGMAYVFAGTIYGDYLLKQRLQSEGIYTQATFVADTQDPSIVAQVRRSRGSKHPRWHTEYRIAYTAYGRSFTNWFEPYQAISHPRPNQSVPIVVDPQNLTKVYDPMSFPIRNNLLNYGLGGLFSISMIFAAVTVAVQDIRRRLRSTDPTRQPPTIHS